MINGREIDLGIALSTFNRKEYHHIFPQKYLKTINTTADKINSLCNFTLLPSDSNKKISSKSPSEYIPDINNCDDVLNANLMPLDKTIYQENNFDKFLEERSALIKQFLDTLLI